MPSKKRSNDLPQSPRTSSSDSPAARARYIEINGKLNAINGTGASVIVLLLVASLWGHWDSLRLVALIQGLVVAFNLWVNVVGLPRHGRKMEVYRIVVNIGSTVLVSRIAAWAPPVWLWLPFVALAFDQFDKRVAMWMVGGLCVIQDGMALWDGVPWIFPACATVLAIFAFEASRVRFAIMREMLLESDRQRGEIERANASLRDAHDRLKAEVLARQHVENELREAHKLEAVGRLAAGVAHEINTPVQFLSDSIHFLRDATEDTTRVLEKLRTVEQSVLDGAPSPEAAKAAKETEEAADLEYVLENVPKAFERALDGLNRVATIVRSMKEFAHPDRKEKTHVDLNRAIEATLTIARNEYKYVADVDTVPGDLPRVLCHGGDVNQAFLNILLNAAHAIADVVQGTSNRGRITVRTYRDGEDAVIAVSDTGGGIPERVRDRIFDPFFTTKEVGRGTGQGLAIARSVVVERHGGKLAFETKIGKGTTFFIRLPIEGAENAPPLKQAAA